jgi:hypothetical protein
MSGGYYRVHVQLWESSAHLVNGGSWNLGSNKWEITREECPLLEKCGSNLPTRKVTYVSFTLKMARSVMFRSGFDIVAGRRLLRAEDDGNY